MKVGVKPGCPFPLVFVIACAHLKEVLLKLKALEVLQPLVGDRSDGETGESFVILCQALIPWPAM